MDEIRIGTGAFTPIVDPAGSAPGAAGAVSTGDRTGFLGALKEAIEQTNAVQLEASDAVERMVTGQNQSLHQTLVALQKADISFQLMMQVRNKIVAAYEEIQRMQL